MRRIAILIGTILGFMIGTVIATAMLIDTTAQEGDEIAFDVTWGPLDETFDDRCQRHRALDGDMPPATLNGFSQVITIRDAEGTTVSMTALREGTLREPATSAGVPVCTITIEETVDPSEGYSIWLDDVYLASIPQGGMPGSASIVLEDWD